MTASPVKPSLKQSFLFGLLLLSSPALAQDGGRDASFMPVGSSASSTPPIALPQLAPVSSTIPAAPAAVAPVIVTPPPTAAPIVTAPPVAVPAPIAAVPVVTSPSVVAAPVIVAPVATAPAVTVPATVAPTSLAPAPVSSAAPAPVVVTPPPAAVPAAAPATKAIEIAKPVETAPIGSIDPQSIGLSGPTEGGLGATMWKGSSRIFVEKLLPEISLPVTSPVLNNLARRMLLTNAAAPEGNTSSSQSLVSMRAEKLVALGDANDAWKLAQLAKPDQIDEITLRLVIEAGLLADVRDDICAKLPEIVKAHTSTEWQKSTLICQLRAKDTKAAQLTLDLLHAQNIKDDVFFAVAEKNVIAPGKQLPRQLTPLKPLTLALLRMTDFQLPGEIYIHPDAPLVPELLQSKSREEGTRVGLAERMAERGLVSAGTLADVYKSVTFTPEMIAAAMNSAETGSRLHALLYQASQQEKLLPTRINMASKYMQTSTAGLLNGAGAEILVQMIGEAAHGDDANLPSGFIAHVYTLAGKGDKALEWIKQAKRAAVGMPAVAAELQSFWPQQVFGGFESDADYAADLGKWLDTFLKGGAAKQRDQAASILMLLEAGGFAVADEQWIKVLDAPLYEKKLVPQAVYFERLRAANGKRGETILASLALAGGVETPILAIAEMVRSLKQVGLTADAALLAREAVTTVLMPPLTKP